MGLTQLDIADFLKELTQGEQARASADRAAQAATADATRAQGVLGAVQDSARLLVNRNRELRASANAVRDAIDRARLAALNAGLEGARLGEPLGKAVLTMADDVRVLLSRGLDALEEHVSSLSELERERERWLEDLTQTQDLCGGAVQRLRELGGLQTALAHNLTRLSGRLRAELGSDGERELLLAEASQRAESLRETLRRLQGHAADPDVAALLEPLQQLLQRPDGKP